MCIKFVYSSFSLLPSPTSNTTVVYNLLYLITTSLSTVISPLEDLEKCSFYFEFC